MYSSGRADTTKGKPMQRKHYDEKIKALRLAIQAISNADDRQDENTIIILKKISQLTAQMAKEIQRSKVAE